MITAALFLLICASFLVLILKKTRIAALFSFLTLLWFVFNGFGFLPELLLSELQTAPRATAPVWKQKNLIILLGGGKAPWPAADGFSTKILAVPRVLESARLYQLCKATANDCRIIISGGDPSRDKISEAQIMARELTESGVNPVDVMTEDQSNNTYQNAKFVAEKIRPADYDTIYLVTSGTHMSRSQILFSHFGINTTPAPADFLSARGRHLTSSGYNFLLADLASHEFVGILQFYIYNWLGLNY